jgi:hypothetical protein
MTSETTPSKVRCLPPPVRPVMRTVTGAAICSEPGMAPCDNDHNTDTEHDIFFVDMS